jgi:hypothetical protein
MRSRVIGLLLGALVLPRLAVAQCGGQERWAVKVGSDRDAALVNVNSPLTKTLHELINIPRPSVPTDDVTRAPQERTVPPLVSREMACA